MAKVYVDKNYINKLFQDVAMEEAKAIILDKVNRQIKISNRELVKSFLENKITQEIQAGPNASNISGTLKGKGNLFSFLGFEQGSDPISQIADFFSNSIKISSIKTDKRNFTVSIIISLPTAKDLDSMAQLPWINKSWISAIKRGISGLGRYLYSDFGFETSRSSTAIQASKKVSGSTSLRPQAYVSKIIETIESKLINDINT